MKSDFGVAVASAFTEAHQSNRDKAHQFAIADMSARAQIDGPRKQAVYYTEAGARPSERLDIRRLLAFRTRLHVEAHLLILLQRLEALGFDFREMSEQVFATIVRCDEAKALCVVEPLYCASCHH
jgi:hypothetical protein